MQDNFTDDDMELLVQYMDGELNKEETEKIETKLSEDAALQEQYYQILSAKRAIRSQGLKQLVSNIHQEYAEEKSKEIKKRKVIKPTSFLKNFLSIAAIFVLIVAGYGVYQFTFTTSQSVYNDAFISYQLPLSRSDNKVSNLDSLYTAENYIDVINTVQSMEQKTQKDYFLLAQSYLRLNKANEAVFAFQQVEKLNQQSREKYFVQETDYYLMLAYIEANKIDLAEKKLETITSDKQHEFYNKAKSISRTKLMMLKWKEKTNK